MELQYIFDSSGNRLAVITPIAEWNDVTAKHEDLKELTVEKTVKKASLYKGLLTNEEAEKFHTYIAKIRDEWQRDI